MHGIQFSTESACRCRQSEGRFGIWPSSPSAQFLVDHGLDTGFEIALAEIAGVGTDRFRFETRLVRFKHTHGVYQTID
jgi:hypothetical protein